MCLVEVEAAISFKLKGMGSNASITSHYFPAHYYQEAEDPLLQGVVMDPLL